MCVLFIIKILLDVKYFYGLVFLYVEEIVSFYLWLRWYRVMVFNLGVVDLWRNGLYCRQYIRSFFIKYKKEVSFGWIQIQIVQSLVRKFFFRVEKKILFFFWVGEILGQDFSLMISTWVGFEFFFVFQLGMSILYGL